MVIVRREYGSLIQTGSEVNVIVKLMYERKGISECRPWYSHLTRELL
jgi:hypothetical protein